MSWNGLEWAGMGLARLHFWLQRAHFGPLKRELGSRNLLILLYPARDSNPHESHPSGTMFSITYHLSGGSSMATLHLSC